jgi:hypothetical protein
MPLDEIVNWSGFKETIAVYDTHPSSEEEMDIVISINLHLHLPDTISRTILLLINALHNLLKDNAHIHIKRITREYGDRDASYCTSAAWVENSWRDFLENHDVDRLYIRISVQSTEENKESLSNERLILDHLESQAQSAFSYHGMRFLP